MTDPYTSIATAVSRLYNEWKKHPKLFIAVDFDDTVFDFHSKGQEHTRVLNTLRECCNLGFYIILWTAGLPSRYDAMVDFLKKEGIYVSSINSNPIDFPYGNNGKIYYNILLDDRAGLGAALDTLNLTIHLIKNTNEYKV